VILLSTIHRAKGLEADTVWLLRPETIPHPMAKTQAAVEQEDHLLYVAITRAKQRLLIVQTHDELVLPMHGGNGGGA
jgi:DNA helicase II / ATP-dependent DNA helicase PcrA